MYMLVAKHNNKMNIHEFASLFKQQSIMVLLEGPCPFCPLRAHPSLPATEGCTH